MTTLLLLAMLAQADSLGSPVGDISGGGGGSFSGGAISSDTTVADDIKMCFGDTTCDWWHIYDSGNTQFELNHTNVDGGGSDGVVMTCADGGDDCNVSGIWTATGGLIVDSDANGLCFGAAGCTDCKVHYDGTDAQVTCGSGDVVFNNSPVVGALKVPDDGGAVGCAIDMSVSATPADNTVESYDLCIDGTAVMTAYSLADGAGSIDNFVFHKYAEAYLDGGSQAAGITVQNQWEQALGCTGGDLLGFTHSACTFTPDGSSAGRYRVDYSVSGVGGNSKDYEFGISVNNVIQPGCRSSRTMGGTAADGAAGSVCIIDVTTTDVKLEIRCTDGTTSDFTYKDIAFVLTRL